MERLAVQVRVPRLVGLARREARDLVVRAARAAGARGEGDGEGGKEQGEHRREHGGCDWTWSQSELSGRSKGGRVLSSSSLER